MEVTVLRRSWGCVHFLHLRAVAPGGMASNGTVGAGLGVRDQPLHPLFSWL